MSTFLSPMAPVETFCNGAEPFARHIEPGRCLRSRHLPIAKLLDLADGRAVSDESFWRTRPDWTYSTEGDE